jgi:hypothetical protein
MGDLCEKDENKVRERVNRLQMTMITIQDKLEFGKREGSPLVQKEKILVQKFLFHDKT